MMPEDRELWGSAALQLVNDAFPSDVTINPSSWPLCSRLMPNVGPLEANAPRTGEAGRGLSRLLNQAGLYLGERGDLTGSLAAAEKSVALSREICSDEPKELLVQLNNLGSRYYHLDQLDRAEGAYREAMTLAEHCVDENDPALAAAMCNLAVVQMQRKDF